MSLGVVLLPLVIVVVVPVAFTALVVVSVNAFLIAALKKSILKVVVVYEEASISCPTIDKTTKAWPTPAAFVAVTTYL
jgi:hypothetical protein